MNCDLSSMYGIRYYSPVPKSRPDSCVNYRSSNTQLLCRSPVEWLPIKIMKGKVVEFVKYYLSMLLAILYD
ncbi:hypothetical protein RUM43_007393 [Polyplax serrata]|uniref:Uncharacterized protein n=1 Tax=Polyplax serrata TaxID=468196 RepID=A0AAN8S1K2_POLSC